MCGWACWGIEIVGNLAIGAQDIAEEYFTGGGATAFIPEEDAAEEEALASWAGSSSSAANGARLGRQLASEQQMAEEGTVIAGAGSGSVIREIDGLIRDFEAR